MIATLKHEMAKTFPCRLNVLLFAFAAGVLLVLIGLRVEAKHQVEKLTQQYQTEAKPRG